MTAEDAAKPTTKAAPAPTVTITATTTATPAPAPAVTVTETVTATATITHQAPAATQDDPATTDSGSDSGGDVYYANCAAARAVGATPVHRGDPGYARHLDRDNDGVGCDNG
ncbi:excalibur calcium-binding domain-containing protein [Streptomyces sp. NPDC016309]|uniref:excalibur calcium-binding domain-containing protein n=1 Tax=Streptomyces sp. NPDC016309 TaxID=3364965 RepID=UPI0037016854